MPHRRLAPTRCGRCCARRRARWTGTPKDRKLHDAIWHTYLQPAATQEQAAELLGLTFNTYRYRLARGTEHITEWLWRHEIAGC